MERKIGEIFEFGGDWYQCVKELPTGGCVGCAFFTNAPCAYASEGNGRNIFDHTGLIFKKLEKVGEPYRRWLSPFNNIMVQRYRLYGRNVIMPDEPIMLLEPNYKNSVEIEIKQNKEDMKEIKLKPFDLEAAKAGKPVCTRDGRKARIICFDAKRKDEKSIIALVPSKDFLGFEDLIAYTNNGNYHGGHENDGDLMMLPEKKEGWVNVYSNRLGGPYESKEYALKLKMEDCIDTVKINWSE